MSSPASLEVPALPRSHARPGWPIARRLLLAVMCAWALGPIPNAGAADAPGAVASIGAAKSGANSAAPTPAQLDFFERRIRPVLVERCYDCHSEASGKAKGGLRVDSREALRRGGETRPAVVPGAPAQSLLLEAIRYENQDLKMPPKGRLAPEVVADFAAWIQDGAPDPREEPSPAATKPDAARLTTGTASPPTRQSPSNAAPHWAFQPLRQVEPPAVSRPARVQSPIDAFLEARLKKAGLKPAPPADRATLLRRVTFDLIGLPPTSEELEAFLADDSPEAFARVVDRLLASPHYGERWGRHWLDLARYADSNGQDENKAMSHAWRYRDYVIDSFNRDKPYDRFILEQLAGDLLPAGATERDTFNQWIATGFLVLGPKMLAEQDKPKLVMDVVDEQIDVVSRAFLGLTVSCSRCHDHKSDPIPARDYYALAGIFKSTKTMGDLAFVSKWNERSVATREDRARIDAHRDRTNRLGPQIVEAQRAADRALRHSLLPKAAEYLEAAERLGSSADSNAVASLAREHDLKPALLARWLQPVAAARTNPASPLHPFLPARQHRDAFLAAIAATAPSPDGSAAAGGRFGPGWSGYGFRGNGASFLEVPHAADLEPAHLTVEAWVRLEATPAPGSGPGAHDPRRWLISKNANEWARGHYALALNGRRPGAYVNTREGPDHAHAVWSDAGPLPTNVWTHLAFTYDGSDLRLYVNGQPAGVTAVGQARQTGQGPLAIGRRQDAFNHFVGDLDEIRLHSRALAPAELAARGGQPAAPLRVWNFEPTTPAEQLAARHAALQALVHEPDGLLAPPRDARAARALYPETEAKALTLLEDDLAKARNDAPGPAPLALAVEEAAPVHLPVHIRGSHLNLGRDPVPRGVPQTFLARFTAAPPKITPIPTNTSGRLELARWLTDPQHPLTARVAVNRVWQAFFGEGLVRTPDNFGLRGEAPSHPELLDWLARDFIEHGWSFKQLHRRILLSAAYQMSTQPSSRGLRVDPENHLLWRMNRKRLEAEPIRDALLAVSGRLDRTMGGTLVSWSNADYVPGDAVSATAARRAVYLPIVRDRVYDVLTTFDFANPSVGTGRRTPTVVAHQALFFLNSPLVREQARHFASSLLAAPPQTDPDRIQSAYRRALGRPATRDEIKAARAFLATTSATAPGAATPAVKPHSAPTSPTPGPAPDQARLEAWTDFCHALLASNEFLYLN